MSRRTPLDRVREICGALPEVTEKEAWGSPTFRVRKRMFAMFLNDHHGDGRLALWCNAPPESLDAIDADPERFFRPPYVGHKGWVGVRLDRGLDWGAVAEVLQDAWRVSAPKRLAAAFDAGGGAGEAASGSPRPARRTPRSRARRHASRR